MKINFHLITALSLTLILPSDSYAKPIADSKPQHPKAFSVEIHGKGQPTILISSLSIADHQVIVTGNAKHFNVRAIKAST